MCNESVNLRTLKSHKNTWKCEIGWLYENISVNCYEIVIQNMWILIIILRTLWSLFQLELAFITEKSGNIKY